MVYFHLLCCCCFMLMQTQHVLTWNVFDVTTPSLYQSHKSQHRFSVTNTIWVYNRGFLSISLAYNKFWVLLRLYFQCEWAQTANAESCVGSECPREMNSECRYTTKLHQSILWWVCLYVSQRQVLLCERTENMQLVSVLCGRRLCPRLKGGLGFSSRCGRLFDFVVFSTVVAGEICQFYFWIQLPCWCSMLPGG